MRWLGRDPWSLRLGGLFVGDHRLGMAHGAETHQEFEAGWVSCESNFVQLRRIYGNTRILFASSTDLVLLGPIAK